MLTSFGAALAGVIGLPKRHRQGLEIQAFGVGLGGLESRALQLSCS